MSGLAWRNARVAAAGAVVAAPLVLAAVAGGTDGDGSVQLLRPAHAQETPAARVPASEGAVAPDDRIILSETMVKQLLSAAVKHVTGRELAIRGDLDIDLGWQATVSAKDVVLGNAAWAGPADMLSIASMLVRLDVRALLQQRIVVETIELDRPRVLVAINKDGQSNLPLPAAAPEQASEPFDPSSLPVVRRIVVRDAELVYVDQRTDVRLEARLAELLLKAEKDKPITLSANGTYDGAPLTLSAEAGSWESLRGGGDRPFPFELNSALGPLRLQVAGALEQARTLSDLRLRVSGDDMPNVYPLTPVLADKTPPFDVAATVKARAEGDARRVEVADLKASFGESSLAGALTAVVGGDKPTVSGKVTSPLIRVADLTGFLPAAAEDAPAADNARVLPADDLDLSALQQVRADLKFAAERVELGKSSLQNVSADVAVQDGVLRVQPVSLAVGDGQATAWMSLYSRADPLQADVVAKARGIELGRLVGDLPLASVQTEGRVRADVDLRMTGNSIAALAGSTDGKIIFTMSQEQMSGLLIELLGLDIAESVGLVLTQADNDTPVPIRCAVGQINASSGILDVATLVIDTEDTRIQGEGNVNLREERLNLRIKPHPKEFSPLSLRVPIAINGTLASPQIFTDPVGRGAETTLDKVLNAVLTPIVGLLPPMDMGTAEDAGCRDLLKEAQEASRG